MANMESHIQTIVTDAAKALTIPFAVEHLETQFFSVTIWRVFIQISIISFIWEVFFRIECIIILLIVVLFYKINIKLNQNPLLYKWLFVKFDQQNLDFEHN